VSKFNKQLFVLSDYSKKFKVERNSFPWLKRQIKNKNILYTGLTPGAEMQAATYAIELGVPFVAVIPYKDLPNYWNLKHKNYYFKLLKKAVKVVYVDRQLKYVSDFFPPDESGPSKEANQIRWLMERILKYPGITKVINYTSGLHSNKSRNLQFYLHNREYDGRWHLTQRTHLTLGEIEEEDDLPF
tara:strand:+ start:271 stop:828 length:558 start_codon:yes stop_codon:yes gene_type:complete